MGYGREILLRVVVGLLRLYIHLELGPNDFTSYFTLVLINRETTMMSMFFDFTSSAEISF